MKFHVKLILCCSVLLLVLAIALMWSVMIFDPVPVIRGDSENSAFAPPPSFAENSAGEAVLRRYNTSSLHELATGSEDLSGNIRQAARSMVLSLLPAETLAAGDETLLLTDGHTALVTGKIILPGSQKEPEKRFRYRVKVNFLPNGSCEAEFPEIRTIE